MDIAHWAAAHRRSLLFLVAILALGGVAEALKLPVALFPQVDFPRVEVSLDAGDRPADQMVIIVTRPVEQAVRAIPGVAGIRSTTSRGSAELSIDFGWGQDMVAVMLQVESAVNQVLPSLPAGTSFSVRRMDPTVFPVAAYSLTSDRVSLIALRDLAKYQLVPLLSSVPGVAKVGVLGGEQAEYRVEIDPVRLAGYGLSFAEVAQAISASNVLQAVGRLEDHYKLYLLLSDTRIRSLEQIRGTVLRSGPGGLVRLDDLARIYPATVPQWRRVTAAGKEAVLVQVYQQPGGNTVQIVQGIKARLQAEQGKLPPGVRVANWYDQSQLITASASSVRDAILIGIALAALVLLIFLRSLKITLVAILVVPAVLATTILLLAVLGMSFNIMTLGGMAAAVGLIVDDAIVMIEQIKLYGDHEDALIQTARRVADAIGAIPGVVDVNSGVVLAGDAVEIVVDRDKAALEGIDPDQVTQQLNAWLTGLVTTQIQEDVKLVGVRVWVPESARDRLRALDAIRLRAADGHLFPLSRIAATQIQVGQPQITRDDLKPMVAVTARISGRDLGSTVRDVRQALATPNLLPADIDFALGGLYQQQQIAFRGLLAVFLAALALVFLLLLFLYEEFLAAIAILISSLLALAGVFAGLWWTGIELNITAMMGMTMILGIVTEVSIFLFSEYQDLIRAGLARREALIQAGVNRMRPIAMTTLAAILALLPLALALGQGAQMQQPLAVAIIAGLLIQMPLVLLFTPALYVWLTPWSRSNAKPDNTTGHSV